MGMQDLVGVRVKVYLYETFNEAGKAHEGDTLSPDVAAKREAKGAISQPLPGK